MAPANRSPGPLRDQELEAWLERAMRTPHPRPDPEPVLRDLDE